MIFDLKGFLNDPNYPYYLVYQCLIAVGLFLSLILYKIGTKKSAFLVPILALTLVVELVADVVKGFAWIYHVFNFFEYTLFCIYYLKNCPVSKYKPLVLWSIPLFVIFSFFVSWSLYSFKSLPALNINIEGLLLFMIYSHLLFSIDTNINMFIYSHPDFWISVGVLTYFGGVFACFNLYSKLLNLDHKQTIHLFVALTIPLNIILYTCITMSQICLIRNKKYFTL